MPRGTIAEVSEDGEHLHIEETGPFSCGNELQANWMELYEKTWLRIEIENPWAGDSESGFGQTCSILLTKEQVKKLTEWLSR